MKKKIYITTPIYYPNAKLHLGHCYTTIICDVYKRYQNEILGNECIMATGSDEHGQKIADTAKKNNLEPKIYVDQIVESFKELWKLLNIDYDLFNRTTDPYHEMSVQLVFEKLLKLNKIYLGKYKTNYCVSCEEGFSKSELVENTKCPKCHRETILIDEETYFLKCSEFQQFIKEIFENNQIDILPESTKKEMINNFINDLKDLSVSRTKVDWGVKISSNHKHTIYVWLDALLNYVTGLGYLQKNNKLFNSFWNEDSTKIHIIGKEISRFHTIYWPIILNALRLPLPNKIISHGWIIAENEAKMSKSAGNVLDPFVLIKIHENNSDILRYYLSRISKIGDDFKFDLANYLHTYNFEMANNIGNLVSRVFSMIQKYCNGQVPKINKFLNQKIINLSTQNKKLVQTYQNLMENFEFKGAINEVLEIIFVANKLIEDLKPWELAKNNDNSNLNELMNALFTVTNTSMHLLSPFIPNTYKKFKTFIISKEALTILKISDAIFSSNFKIAKCEPLFIRKID